MLNCLGPGNYYLDYGPVQMNIKAFAGIKPLYGEIEAVQTLIHDLLADLSSCLDLAKKAPDNDSLEITRPAVLFSMLEAVRAPGDSCLTPMAAVAGAFADEVARFLADRGATRVIVNNGGDIALHLAPGESINVGLKSSLTGNRCTHLFSIDGASGCRGIATSGLGGRGFTMGIASAVTVLAEKGALADACATSIANKTNVDDPDVKRLPAILLDPQTDLGENLVTVDCKGLKLSSYRLALEAGVAWAETLLNKKVILGAAIFAGPLKTVLPDTFSARIMKVENAGTVPRAFKREVIGS